MKQAESGAGPLFSSSRRPYTIKSVIKAATILRAFKSSSEVLELRFIAERVRFNKTTAFRLAETLVEAGLLDRIGQQGYRLRIDMTPSRKYRIGYAAQSQVVQFTATVTDSLITAASAANTELLVLNNNFSAKTALMNADRFIKEKVDLVIDAQLDFQIAPQIATKFSEAQIPFIALDLPHPGTFYFGVDNYKAGRLAGRHVGKWAVKFWQGHPGKIILIGADFAGPHLKARIVGFQDGLHEIVPEIRNLPSHYLDTKALFDRTLDAMRKLLRRQKVKKALVFAVNDTSALAALQAIREFGIEDECAVAGQDASVEAREEMRRPATRLVCSVAFFPENYGRALMRIATDILSGKPVPPATFVEHELVTPANVDRIYPNDAWLNAQGRSAS